VFVGNIACKGYRRVVVGIAYIVVAYKEDIQMVVGNVVDYLKLKGKFLLQNITFLGEILVFERSEHFGHWDEHYELDDLGVFDGFGGEYYGHFGLYLVR